MKIFTRLATLLGRLREREADTNPEATKPKKKNKASSSSSGGNSGNKKKRRQTQTILKPCLKHPDPNAKPKKRKWSIKFSERVTVYEIQEIVDNSKKKAAATAVASPDDANKIHNIQNSERVSKAGNLTPTAPTEYKTRLRIYYDQLAKPSKKSKKLQSENGLHK